MDDFSHTCADASARLVPSSSRAVTRITPSSPSSVFLLFCDTASCCILLSCEYWPSSFEGCRSSDARRSAICLVVFAKFQVQWSERKKFAWTFYRHPTRKTARVLLLVLQLGRNGTLPSTTWTHLESRTNIGCQRVMDGSTEPGLWSTTHI